VIALSVRVERDAAEVVLAELLDLAPGGLEERDTPEGIEYVLYGAPAALPSEAALRSAAGEALIGLTRVEVADDWSERWKSWHRPVDVAVGGRRVRVRPPWEPPLQGAGIDLVIDPGQAFGTGGHHTTRLCLELLLERTPSGSLADWGCGTGVLALAAARLGFMPVAAVDVDEAALEATRANALANGIDGLSVAACDLTREPGPTADVVVANLVRPLLLGVAARMAQPPPVLIASGLLRGEADEIAAAFQERGLRETRRRSAGEWTALALAHAPS
jgi:ribosomal protein L11 methyltransferase